MTNEPEYDYIIVGAGAAGCVLAHRLLLGRPDRRVLLLEAGGPDDLPAIHRTDLGSVSSLWGSEVAWKYATQPGAAVDGRVIQIAQGKVLGGGSSINALLHVRGNRRDFEHWAHLGNEGWSYAEVLADFKKSEDYDGGASFYRGVGGPLRIARGADPAPVSRAFVAAAMELGFAGDGFDYNAERQEDGAFFYDSTRTPDNQRCSTAEAFLRPVLGHGQLRVETGALATRVVLGGLRATGVEYLRDGQPCRARAGAEVLLSCGAFASPKLLMLSGIGPAEHLRAHGLEVVVDLPGVGQNLHDHMLLGVGYQCTQALPNPRLLAEAGLFTYSHDGPRTDSPDLQFFFGPVQFVEPEYRVEGPSFTLAPVLAQPRSRGTVTLRSADPRDLAVVRPNYLACQADVDVLVRGIKLARELVATRAFDAFRGRELAPGAAAISRGDLAVYVRKVATTVWHPVGTCRMGRDRDAVVNPRLQVHGVDGLRVADASIMPRIPCGNTNAATIMIAEKSADLIIGGQPPSHRQP